MAKQVFQNVNTGETKEIDSFEVANSGQGLANEGYVPIATPKPVLGVSNVESPSQGTEDIQDEIKVTGDSLQSGIGNLESETESTTAILERLSKERESINELTSEDLTAIEEAGVSAGEAFDPLIDEAKETRRTTLPSAVVRAGEAGGFENTQMSGVAALLPTDKAKGAAFVGAGGRLDRVRQDLDRNISLIQAKKQEAIQAAKAAQRTAIKTGKKEDYQSALELVKLAQQFKTDEEDQMIKRNQFLLDTKAEDRLQTASKESIARAKEASAIADKEYQIKEAEFITDNEDRVAEALGTQLISLDENNEIVQPTTEEIQTLADQEGISANILAGAINKRIDEITKTQRENRSAKLEELKFLEVQQQNDINNQLEQMRINISGGNLALSRAKFVQETMGTTEGFSDKANEAKVRQSVVDFAEEVRRGETGLTQDSALMQLRAMYGDSIVSNEALESVWLQANGLSPAGEEDIQVGETAAVTPSDYNTGAGAIGETLRKSVPTLIQALGSAIPRLSLKSAQIANNLIAGLRGKKDDEVTNEELNAVENLLKLN